MPSEAEPLPADTVAESGADIGRSESAILGSPGTFKSVITPLIGASPLFGVNVKLCIQATAWPGLVEQEVKV
jgi:hypothetical protein